MSRVLVWFSDGAASAVAAKLAIRKHGAVEVLKCDTTSTEHSDNLRFRADVERWIGQPVTLLRSDRYRDIDDVFERTRYMAGNAGARCTTELKKLVRRAYEREGDTHVFGYTADEPSRVRDFEVNNPELLCDWILVERGITKADCYQILSDAEIALPAINSLSVQLVRDCTLRHAERMIAGAWTLPLPNVWLGVSVEDQRRADERIPKLLDTPAAVRFISAEPLLGPIQFAGLCADWLNDVGGLDWVIVGGESGANHRPMEVAWAEEIAAQCGDAVALFVKQDSGPRPGKQGRLSDALWSRKEYPVRVDAETQPKETDHEA